MNVATVAPLTKVTVSRGPAPERRGVSFILGVGPEGLTPFEHLLFGRAVGEEVQVTVAADETGAFFGHLAPAVRSIFDCAGPVAFTARIDAVDRPDPREVVRALAAATGHGPCDCGCGCGGSVGKREALDGQADS